MADLNEQVTQLAKYVKTRIVNMPELTEPQWQKVKGYLLDEIEAGIRMNGMKMETTKFSLVEEPDPQC